MAKDSTFAIGDLRGGINTTDSPTLLKPNEVVDAVNVDFRDGALGSKRRGTEAIDVSGAAFDSPIAALFRHTPTNSLTDDELWGIDENGNIDRRVGGSWQGGVPAANDFVIINTFNFDANAASLHGKLFIAARGSLDRLLVWDGTILRWAGIQQPPDPTVANSGVAGTYTGTRYVRIRFAEQDADGVTLRRSEPTNVVSLVPSGANSGAVVTKPAGTEATTSSYAEGQTHWEVEASTDNILFYRIATVAIGTPTYTDTTSYTTGYAANTLSEQVGEYVPPGAARHVAVDEDRILVSGSHFESGEDATVWWTPVAGDDGVGNDERIPTATSQYIRFDGLDGGRVTALVSGGSGSVYVFKLRRVYKMVRTGIASAAYQPVTESFGRGATMLGATAGSDHSGVPCVYFVDSHVGLCRIGQRGVEDLARPIRETWSGLNLSAAIAPRVLYYPELDQVWYTSPTGSGDPIYTAEGDQILTADGDPILSSQTTPERLIVYEARYGSHVFFEGLPGTAHALSLMFDGTTLKPVIGTEEVDGGGGNLSSIHIADTGTTDSSTEFSAYITTKPYALGDFWAKFGLMAAVLLAKADPSILTIWLIRNFGVEELSIPVDLTPIGAESHVIKPIDNASMSELNTVQVKIGDPAASDQAWSLDQLVFRIQEEEGSC